MVLSVPTASAGVLLTMAKATPFGAPDNWATWLADMDGAKVTLYTTNNGDGTVDIKYDIVAANGHKYHMGYTGISGVNANDFFVKLSLSRRLTWSLILL